MHRCRRICHRAECSPDGGCPQPCVLPRPDCGHPCLAPCHKGSSCPGNPCTTKVVYFSLVNIGERRGTLIIVMTSRFLGDFAVRLWSKKGAGGLHRSSQLLSEVSWTAGRRNETVSLFFYKAVVCLSTADTQPSPWRANCQTCSSATPWTSACSSLRRR